MTSSLNAVDLSLDAVDLIRNSSRRNHNILLWRSKKQELYQKSKAHLNCCMPSIKTDFDLKVSAWAVAGILPPLNMHSLMFENFDNLPYFYGFFQQFLCFSKFTSVL